MQVVCDSTQSKDCEVSVVALQCLVRIATLYYPHLNQYMDEALIVVS